MIGEKEIRLKPVDVIFRHMKTQHWTMDRAHYHDHYEINLTISGGNRFFINDRSVKAENGDLFYFTNKDMHRNIVPDDFNYERYLIMFNPALISDLCTEKVDLLSFFHSSKGIRHNNLSLGKEDLLLLTSLLNEIIYQSKVSYGDNYVYKKIKLAEVLLFIWHVSKKRLINKPIEVNPSATTYPKIQPVVEYINLHLLDDLRINTLAEKFYMNRSYLCKLFKLETGFTINEYITQMRLFRAKDLLSMGKTVTEVTSEVGYSNTAHFIRVFKKTIGQTPKQYALTQRTNYSSYSPIDKTLQSSQL